MWESRTPPVEQLEKETPTAVAEYRSSGEGYQVVVPIANPANISQLMRTAMALARDNEGEILVMSVVTVPEQTPLSRGSEQADEKREVLNRAMAIAEDHDIPVSGTIRIGHNAADGILNTITQHDSNAVIVGWKGSRTQRRDVILGTNVDRIAKEADCNVFVEKFGMAADGTMDSMLVPVAGGPHAKLAIETAGAIARDTGATIHAVYVINPDASEEARQQGESMLADRTASLWDVAVETSLLESDDVVNALVDESATHNLTIIGAAREGVV